jgi:proteic killer suppression protein
MIQSIRHKGLKLFFENDTAAKLPAHHIEKIRRILYRLDEAEAIEDLNIVGWALHPLSGDLKGFWSVKVNGNYRIIFRFQEGIATDVDYIDYH